jgi:thiol-disulfide isomerase/thioredoxin
MRMRRGLIAVALVAVFALAGCTSSVGIAGDYGNDSGTAYTDNSGEPVLVKPADRTKSLNFTGKIEDGSPLTLSDYRGKVVVVNFWYSSCAPCRAEAPILEGLYEKYQDKGVAFIGVNTVDESQTALSFEKAHGITYPSVMDANVGTAAIAFHGQVAASAVPVTFVLDRKGRIAARILGELQSSSILNTLITDTLAESK